jgi:hypothetical protein
VLEIGTKEAPQMVRPRSHRAPIPARSGESDEHVERTNDTWPFPVPPEQRERVPDQTVGERRHHEGGRRQSDPV